MPVKKWIEETLNTSSIALTTLSSDILIESCMLPGRIHVDLADRMIISTARMNNALLISRDSQILEYGRTGHVTCIEG